MHYQTIYKKKFREVNNRVVDNGILAKRSQDPLTSEERKFFNEINTEVGYKEEKLLPETVIERVFDDLQSEHPLLSKINIQNAGLVTRIIKAEPTGQAFGVKSLVKSKVN